MSLDSFKSELELRPREFTVKQATDERRENEGRFQNVAARDTKPVGLRDELSPIEQKRTILYVLIV